MTNKKIIFPLCIILMIIAFLYKCPYSYLLGISCPGCGMTRAFLALIQLDFKSAFYFHPLVGVVIMIMLYIVTSKFNVIIFSKQSKGFLFWGISGLFIAVYVIRLFSGSEIVYFRLEESLIFKIYHYIKTACIF